MQLKRVRGISVKEALAAVRAELGPDALVLSTQWVPAPGLRGLMGQRDVEIMAAIDPALSENRQAAAASTASRTDAGRDARDTRAAVAPGVMTSLFARQAKRADAPPQDVSDDADADALVARLCAAGLNRELAAAVVEALPRRERRAASMKALREALSSRLAPMATGTEARTKIEVFVGPPGAGKTTTIAKLAAQARAKNGARLSLLAADGFRVGAVEQLRLYSEIIGSPFSIARTAADIDAAVTMLRGPVLVDTAGRSPSDGALGDVFAALADRPGVRTHLVMPASLTPRQAERLIDRYEAARPSRVVLTKTDESDSWAPLLPVLHARGLALSFLGTGQRVPDDLVAVTPAVLAGAVLGEGEGAAA